jgi:hypothetical protein
MARALESLDDVDYLDELKEKPPGPRSRERERVSG